jgi:hypothetical protein
MKLQHIRSKCLTVKKRQDLGCMSTDPQAKDQFATQQPDKFKVAIIIVQNCNVKHALKNVLFMCSTLICYSMICRVYPEI